jgi:hypothetical protein
MALNSNFGFLSNHDPLFLELSTAAERAFACDPNTTLIKLRQFGEALAQDIAAGPFVAPTDRSQELRDLTIQIEQLKAKLQDANQQVGTNQQLIQLTAREKEQYADQIEQSVKDAQSSVNQLTQAILAKSFRGELAAGWRAQNPDLVSGDNSAESLLAKIKAERLTEKTNSGRKARA